MTTSTCSGCGAAIVWITTAAGKSMPLDARAETLWLLDAEGAQTGSTRARPVQVRRSHFASCPQADQFRGRGRRP